MSNTVYDVDFTRALPEPLKNDENMLALGRVIADELQENIRLARLNIIYARIDELEEAVLDILAHDLHIDWYDCESPIDIKRTVIKESVKVHKLMGTRPGVESVVRAYFGSGEVRHWYEYGGEPHHFRVISSNPSMTDERFTEFIRIMSSVKRLSSWLDNILITLTGEMQLFFGVLLNEFTREAHIMGEIDFIDQLITIRTAHVLREHTRQAHIFGTQESVNINFAVMLYERTAEARAFGGGEIEVTHGALHYEQANETHIITKKGD
jgi:phage tail P2-like protein